MKNRNIYLVSTLALLSLTTLAYAKPSHAQADFITTNDATPVTNVANPVNNSSSATPNQQSAANNSQQSVTNVNVVSSNATSTISATTSNTTVSQNSSAVAPTTSTTPVTSSEAAQAQVAAQYTVSHAAARTAYDGTPIISIGDSQYPRVDAVDISAYQAGLNYNNFVSLKNTGVKTIIVKLTEGTGYTNQYAGQQINNARNAGLNIQVYHYAHFGSWNAAVNEANHLASVMNALGLSKDTRIYADMEDNTTKYAGVANDLNGFWTQLNNLGFTNHAVYASVAYDRQYNVSSTVGKNRTWIAQYLYNPSPYYLANQSYGAWQFNAHGTIPGYNGELDLSIDYQNLLTGDTGHWDHTNNHWYYNQNGQNVTGWQKINGNWYYFNNDGAAQTGWFKSGAGNWYYFDQNNAWALTGWQSINNHWYYFDPTNAWADCGWFQSGAGRWYYFDWNNAWALTGWQGINGHWYYFDQNNAWALTGWQWLDNNWLYFDPTNAWQDKGGWQKIDGNWYYFEGDKGHMLTGLQTINGHVYDLRTDHDGYFGAMKTGWQKINGHWYYFDNSGAATTGWYQSGAGNWYYFNNDGTARTGWQSINGRWYYFDQNNAWALRGWQWLYNSWFYFDPVNAWQYKGWQNIDNHWYYINDKGSMLTGLQWINGKLYDLRTDHDGYYGAMRTGWQTINGHRYYFASDGHAVTGPQYIDGHLYEFNDAGQLKADCKK